MIHIFPDGYLGGRLYQCPRLSSFGTSIPQALTMSVTFSVPINSHLFESTCRQIFFWTQINIRGLVLGLSVSCLSSRFVNQSHESFVLIDLESLLKLSMKRPLILVSFSVSSSYVICSRFFLSQVFGISPHSLEVSLHCLPGNSSTTYAHSLHTLHYQ